MTRRRVLGLDRLGAEKTRKKSVQNGWAGVQVDGAMNFASAKCS